MPTPGARALMELFGLRYPIFSAGMGATAVPELAIAVSNAGGLGAIGTGVNAVPEVVRQRVAQTKSATDRPFAVNFLLPRDPVTLPLALDAGARSFNSRGAFRQRKPSPRSGRRARRSAFRSAASPVRGGPLTLARTI